MPVANSDITGLTVAGAKTLFMSIFRDKLSSSLVNSFATVVPTTLPTQSYDWLSAIPAMREWTDERQHKAIKALNYSITDKLWESTVSIKRRAWENDQYGVLAIRMQQLASRAAQNRLKQATAILTALTTGYDAAAIIADSHTESGTAQDNKSTNALSEGEIASAIAIMGAFTDDQGEPLLISPTTLMVGPKNEFIARRIVESANIVVTGGITLTSTATVTGNKNVLQSRLNVLVNPYLIGTYDDYWFLVASDEPVGPVIVQERTDVPLEFVAKTDPSTSDIVFERDECVFGARIVEGYGAGLWQTVYGGIL